MIEFASSAAAAALAPPSTVPAPPLTPAPASPPAPRSPVTEALLKEWHGSAGLGEEIARMSAHIEAATGRQLELIRAFQSTR